MTSRKRKHEEENTKQSKIKTEENNTNTVEPTNNWVFAYSISTQSDEERSTEEFVSQNIGNIIGIIGITSLFMSNNQYPIVNSRISNDSQNTNRNDLLIGITTHTFESRTTVESSIFDVDRLMVELLNVYTELFKKKRNILSVEELKKIPIRLFKMSKNTTNTEESLHCAICRSNYEDNEELRDIECGHSFHASCVDPWFLESSSTCPMCRKDVLKKNQNS